MPETSQVLAIDNKFWKARDFGYSLFDGHVILVHSLKLFIERDTAVSAFQVVLICIIAMFYFKIR